MKLNTIEACVGTCQTIHEYENVTINIISGGHMRLVTIKWRNRSCEQLAKYPITLIVFGESAKQCCLSRLTVGS